MTYGGSAGGHLSAFLALAANSKREYTAGLDANPFKGAISLYGIHDLTMTIQRENQSTEQYIGISYDKDPINYTEASTISHVDKSDPPLLMMHGSIDGSVSVKNSDHLSSVLDANGVIYTYDRIEGWPHVMDFFSPVGERTLWQIHKFLEQHMPSEELKNEIK